MSKTITLKLTYTETFVVPVVTDDDSIDVEERLTSMEHGDLDEIADALRDGASIVGSPKFSPSESQYHIETREGCDFDPEANFHVVLDEDGFYYRPLDNVTEPSILPVWNDEWKFIRRLIVGEVTYDIYRCEGGASDEWVMWAARYGQGVGEFRRLMESELLELEGDDWEFGPLREFAPLYQSLQAFVREWLNEKDNKGESDG